MPGPLIYPLLIFFLWGYLIKSRVHREIPTRLDQLKETIWTEIGLISSEMTTEVIRDMRKRIDLCIASQRTPFEGYHLQEVVTIKAMDFKNPTIPLVLCFVSSVKSY